MPCNYGGSQSGAQSKKPRVVRGLRPPQGLLSRFEVFVLAEREGFEPSVRENRTPDFESGTFDHSATSPKLVATVVNGEAK